MTEHPEVDPAADAARRCGNCGQPLDESDKFCRECGLPTLRRAHAQHTVPLAPPDARELRQALDAVPDPRPFVRPDPLEPPDDAQPDLTTGSVVKATSPTFAAQLASSTAVMVGLIVVLALIGVTLLVMAFRP